MGDNRTNRGLTKTTEYLAWTRMWRRVREVGTKRAEYYYEKGITVCDRWKGGEGFKNFLADMGLAPSKKHTPDRYPNIDGDYEPGNVRWATHKEQCRNRSSNVIITYEGETKTLIEWCEYLGVPYKALRLRLKRASFQEAIKKPFLDRRRFLEFNGKKQILSDWSKATGIKITTLLIRLDTCGWSIEKALTTPVKTPKRK